jgi:hypothetical protein
MQRVLELEIDLENRKINLSQQFDFNLIDAFRSLDTGGNGTINVYEIH